MFGRLWWGVVRPCARRVPVDALRKAHTARRAVVPSRYTDADPFKTLRIDPRAVERSNLRPRHRLYSWGRVVGGDWDDDLERFDERRVPRALRQHFVEGVDWDETPLRDVFDEQRAAGLTRTAWGHTDYGARCDELERLYASMESDGYVTQAELVGETRRALPVFDEINIDITCDGEAVWCGYGQHRLALARILGLEEVAVVVQRRHADWQARRDELRENGYAGDSTLHPDLRDLTQT